MYVYLSLQFNIVLEVLANVVRQKVKLKSTHTVEEELKHFLIKGDMLIYVKVPGKSMKLCIQQTKY